MVLSTFTMQCRQQLGLPAGSCLLFIFELDNYQGNKLILSIISLQSRQELGLVARPCLLSLCKVDNN